MIKSVDRIIALHRLLHVKQRALLGVPKAQRVGFHEPCDEIEAEIQLLRHVDEEWHRGELGMEAERVFNLIAAHDEGSANSITKEELVAAHGGDFNIFSTIDDDGDGIVSRYEWHRWLNVTHEAQGDRWLASVLHTLSRRLKAKMQNEFEEFRDLPPGDVDENDENDEGPAPPVPSMHVSSNDAPAPPLTPNCGLDFGGGALSLAERGYRAVEYEYDQIDLALTQLATKEVDAGGHAGRDVSYDLDLCHLSHLSHLSH